jgi:c-di-GMP-binding flagellar brake protein YcgR
LIAERRILPRFTLQMPVSVVIPGNGLKINGTTRDVSAGGIFFYADAPVAVQQEIELVMTLSQDAQASAVHVACRARILRVEEDHGKTGIAAAIQKFDFLSTQEVSRV